MPATVCQQISYIAPAAPARRQPATGDEPFMRPEIGFTPNWFRTALGIDFGERWHTDPAYRRETVLAMRGELKRRFPGSKIGGIDRPDRPLDLLTGVYGGNVVAMLYGVPIIYAEDNWPNCEHKYLSDDEADNLQPPDLDRSAVFGDIMKQVDWIAESEGEIHGFLNWQGILNNAQRLRGEKIFFDIMDSPDRCRRLFECIYSTMSEAIKRLHERQTQSGVEINFMTVSNCLVNMISPEQYRQLFLPYDQRFEQEFGCIAIHNCAWNADPYIEDYAGIRNLGYVDMGMDSDLARARQMTPNARRALMYTPMDLANKTWEEVREDIERIARDYGPCDIVAADIEADTPDERVQALIDLCEEISDRKENQ
ncbi:MAG: uroporphyrinogen decarboxylase family protein [Planctomycetota bacterium]